MMRIYAARAILALSQMDMGDEFRYDPNQPRDSRGRWTRSAAGGLLHVAGDALSEARRRLKNHRARKRRALKGSAVRGGLPQGEEKLRREHPETDQVIPGTELRRAQASHSVARYTMDSSGSGEIDSFLRQNGGRVPADVPTRFGSAIPDLDSLMSVSRSDKPIVLHRGIKSGEGTFGPDWRDGSLVGAEWVDHGFSLNTSDPDLVSGSLTPDGSGVRLNVLVPKGTRAYDATVGDKAAEVILDRNLTYRVVADYGIQDGERVLDVEIVPAAKAAKNAMVDAAEKRLDAWRERRSRALKDQEALNAPPGVSLRDLQDRYRQRPGDGKTIGGVDAKMVASALGDYKGSGYTEMNSGLRKAKGEKIQDFFLRSNVNSVDAALSELPADVLTFRGIGSGKGTFGPQWEAEYADKPMVGMEWTEWGYSSSSPNLATAEGFTSVSGVRLNVLVPKGTKAIDLSGSTNWEPELLLERGLKYRVVGDQGWKQGTGGARERVLDVEIVPS